MVVESLAVPPLHPQIFLRLSWGERKKQAPAVSLWVLSPNPCFQAGGQGRGPRPGSFSHPEKVIFHGPETMALKSPWTWQEPVYPAVRLRYSDGPPRPLTGEDPRGTAVLPAASRSSEQHQWPASLPHFCCQSARCPGLFTRNWPPCKGSKRWPWARLRQEAGRAVIGGAAVLSSQHGPTLLLQRSPLSGSMLTFQACGTSS